MKKIEEIKLSTWAKENNIPYKTAWEQYNNDTLPVKTRETKTGRIVVMKEIEASEQQAVNKIVTFGQPMMTASDAKYESKASSRFNKSALTTPAFQYSQISQGIVPYEQTGDGTGNSCISVSDAIRLCQKCYFNFPIFALTINAMVEFSTNKLYFRGGNVKSRKFFEEWLESINILDFEDKFFREYYRSCNVFPYRFDAIPQEDDIKRLNKTFGISAAKDVKIPIKYIILNPVDIGVYATYSFSDNVVYYKRLNGYELNRLKSPKTPEEKNFFDSLPEETKKQIKNNAGSIDIPLDNDKVYAIFYSKQDYEPMAIPMGFAVLKDIEWKAEMKSIDLAVSRTMQNCVLLVKMGYESKNGEYVYDQQAANTMRSLFESESVGKTLVADFTTEVEFKIPQIGDFLDPKKYQIVNEDIKTGLNYVLTGTDQKFSNQYIQVQLFIQRLIRAREAFLTGFLIPEIKRVSKDLGFRSVPQPYFHDIDLKDTAEFNRILAQLYQYGLLTPGETFEALESGKLPNKEESELAQEEFRKHKDKGFYEPITGGPASSEKMLDKTNKQQTKMQETQFEHDKQEKGKDRKHAAENPEPKAPQIILNAPTKMAKPSGKPAGKTGKQSKTRRTRVSKAGVEIQEVSEELYSLSKIKDNLILASQLKNEVKDALLSKYKVKELNPEQSQIVSEITEVIMANQESSEWLNNVKKYVDAPINDNLEKNKQIDEISYRHQIDNFAAIILANSIKEMEENEKNDEEIV